MSCAYPKIRCAEEILMSIASCIHWYNPLIWICCRFYRKDQELACDERVLRSMNFKDAKEYAATLISLSAKNEREPLFLEGFQKKNAERERILSAIENRKMGIVGSIAAIILEECYPDRNYMNKN